MAAKIIDGRRIAQEERARLRGRIEALVRQGVTPGLAVVMVGDDPASNLYVRNKTRACEELGMRSYVHRLAADVTQEAVISRVRSLNEDPEVHGIIVQLPLPRRLDVREVVKSIAVQKDVDGFHLYNVGGLMIGDIVFPPCTPYGVQVLLERTGIPVEGQNVVVVGASNIVGKPMAMLLLQKDATVSICHVKTRDLAQYTILADILVVAAGKPNLIRPEMVRRGAVVIDVGINRLPDGRLVGDVDFDGVRERASYITPVPGGVGPMTVTMLLYNTVRAAERVAGLVAAPA
ncbi:MAG TPA: bifunctional methylenetetrahydrofolate dehydrogenase/methenyltetrahydrofolate cyclohydrolase FolD [Burkholderiales bacterium]|nr:bifunctional methylenetetrahydrofolate dehydrogenase/methenyltetrahydrofolate cyclohydrolase FolD [Burkholderiales bacterium]